MSGDQVTPGQAAFAEYYGRQAGAALHMPTSWDMQSDGTRADWEAAAQAAIDASRTRLDVDPLSRGIQIGNGNTQANVFR